MLKLCWFEFKNKIVASINWERRQVFEKWDKVIVTEKDKLTLMRLGWKLIWEKEVWFDDVFIELETTNPTDKEKKALKTQIDELNLKVKELEETLKNTQESETQTDEIEEVIMNKTQIIEELKKIWVEFNKNALKEDLAKLLQDTLNAVDETETPKSE